MGLAVGLLLLLVAVSAAQCLLGVGRAHRQSRGSAVPPPRRDSIPHLLHLHQAENLPKAAGSCVG